MSRPSESRASLIIELILRGTIREIIPNFDPRIGYEYCGQLRKFGIEECDEVMQMIMELFEIGVLKREIHDRVASCSKCGSEVFIVRARCPYCGSLDFRRGEVIEHIPCGFVGFESEFIASGGRLLCPKCRKELRPGDSLRVADLYKCGNCGEVFSIPSYSHQCLNCGYENKEIELKSKEIYRYVVVQECLRGDPLITLRDLIREEVADTGCRVLGPIAKLKGASGAEFEFDLVIDGPDGSHLIALDLLSSPNSEKLMATFAKAHGTGVRRMVILHEGEVDDLTRDLARKLNLELLKLDDARETARRIVEMLRKGFD